MKRNTQARRREILDKMIVYFHERLPKQQAKLVGAFVEQFYATVALEDLEAHSIMDLCGAALSHWNLIAQRKRGEALVRVYNPDFEQHGWQSTHTIIEVAHDDMPFLVDSLAMEIIRQGLTIHLAIHMGGLKLKCNAQNKIIQVLPAHAEVTKDVRVEAPIYFEVDRQTDEVFLHSLKAALEHILCDVRVAVTDWHDMEARMRMALDELSESKAPLNQEDKLESVEFLRWLLAGNFIFLGYREYKLSGTGQNKILELIEDSGLGVLQDVSGAVTRRPLTTLPEEAQQQALSTEYALIIAKTNTQSTVHRPAYTDYIGVKRFNEAGEVIGEHRFIGLFTSIAYNSNARQIPLLRRKVEKIMELSKLPPKSHASKVLIHILDTLPRDDLFQAPVEELVELGLGILNLQERQRIRLFVRKDIYGRFMSCLVYVPRERFNTELRKAMQQTLLEAFNGYEATFSTWFSESVLARIHFVIRIDPKIPLEYDVKELEAKLVEIGRTWKEELRDYLLEKFGEEKGNLLAQKYADAFQAGYRENFSPRAAIYDIEHMERLSSDNPLVMNMYHPFDEVPGIIRFKLYQLEDTTTLSGVLPMLENMGLHVIRERPYKVELQEAPTIWINDFRMCHAHNKEIDIGEVKEIFQEAFGRIWHGDATNDGFNYLVLAAKLTWQEVAVLRAYAKYFRQIRFTFSLDYIEETLAKHAEIAARLIELFKLRFDPEDIPNRSRQLKRLRLIIEKDLDAIVNLDEDRILRHYLAAISATLRTNYFQKMKDGRSKPYLSFKFDPSKIPGSPLPHPMYEIFVCSPWLEAVHLRGGKVARGGLRWSDRREDFRTEVLGLMKAQQVKNALIVPSGAKGGFVPKDLPAKGTREEIMQKVITCYKMFISGLLDLTDNLKNGKILPPANTYRYDGDDHYLVVAADKGTATFSDIANGIAKEYGFWLGDAFASGGSAGYDHKKMGITARGAWESVKRHFRGMGIDTQKEPFTVVGIGDMSGDVFGNGMLLSRKIKLVAAFNHMHIFLDPDPDPETSYKERERLFNLPRSTWEDYDPRLLSSGGGVYSRSAKSIKLTPEVKKWLGIEKDSMTPNDLIREILKAPVDLLWNGGIGTYVKSSKESNTEVGDRANDSVRVNGNELRCRVVVEGGNLGFTQLGRVEYSLNGGILYTDFIDNSAGVNCSDHEVNIKILLNKIVANGDLTEKQRNKLLVEMTEEVAQLVLGDNYQQTQAIDLEASLAATNVSLHGRYLDALEQQGRINRALEYLPDDNALLERKVAGKGLTNPEIAVLMAYTKILIKQEILASSLPEDPCLVNYLMAIFPKPLQERYQQSINEHSLRREIIATQLSNEMINRMGVTFVYRLQDETGDSVESIVRAYVIACRTLEIDETWRAVQALDLKVPSSLQTKMLMMLVRLTRYAARWFVRNCKANLNIQELSEQFRPGIRKLRQYLLKQIVGKGKPEFRVNNTLADFISAGVPAPLAETLTCVDGLFSGPEIIDGAKEQGISIEDMAYVYYQLNGLLELDWLRQQIVRRPAESRWEVLARSALRIELDRHQRNVSVGILNYKAQEKLTPAERLAKWMEEQSALQERWMALVSLLRGSDALDYIMFFVAVKELGELSEMVKKFS